MKNKLKLDYSMMALALTAMFMFLWANPRTVTSFDVMPEEQEQTYNAVGTTAVPQEEATTNTTDAMSEQIPGSATTPDQGYKQEPDNTYY